MLDLSFDCFSFIISDGTATISGFGSVEDDDILVLYIEIYLYYFVTISILLPSVTHYYSICNILPYGYSLSYIKCYFTSGVF